VRASPAQVVANCPGPRAGDDVTEVDKAQAYVRNLLAGLTPLDPKALPGFANVKTGITDPPAYVVRLLLLGLLGFPDLGPDEKVWWQTAFRFNNQDFLVRDHKFGTWSIEAASPKDAAPFVDELERRLRGASGKVDTALVDELRGEVKAERYWLVNSFYRLHALYEDYRDRTSASVKAYDALADAKDEPGKLFSVYNARIKAQTRAAHDAFGLLGAFFSLLEFLLSAMYALHRTTGTYADFAKLELQDQFRALFPITTDKDWDRLYNRVNQLRKNYRNPLHHGLSDDERGVLVPYKGLGLIPLSYRYLADGLRFGYSLGITIDEVREVVATCADVLDALRRRDPYHYYLAFIEGGFAIPVADEDAAHLRELMTSREDFAEYVAQRERYEDDVINRDI
jgi:hypothetical protein